jgi:hypothetical protein
MRWQLRILIAAKQPSAKLQSAKSTEDENSEGKMNDSNGANANAKIQVSLSIVFAHLTPRREPSWLLLSVPAIGLLIANRRSL